MCHVIKYKTTNGGKTVRERKEKWQQICERDTRAFCAGYKQHGKSGETESPGGPDANPSAQRRENVRRESPAHEQTDG